MICKKNQTEVNTINFYCIGFRNFKKHIMNNKIRIKYIGLIKEGSNVNGKNLRIFDQMFWIIPNYKTFITLIHTTLSWINSLTEFILH